MAFDERIDSLVFDEYLARKFAKVEALIAVAGAAWFAPDASEGPAVFWAMGFCGALGLAGAFGMLWYAGRRRRKWARLSQLGGRDEEAACALRRQYLLVSHNRAAARLLGRATGVIAASGAICLAVGNAPTVRSLLLGLNEQALENWLGTVYAVGPLMLPLIALGLLELVWCKTAARRILAEADRSLERAVEEGVLSPGQALTLREELLEEEDGEWEDD